MAASFALRAKRDGEGPALGADGEAAVDVPAAVVVVAVGTDSACGAEAGDVALPSAGALALRRVRA